MEIPRRGAKRQTVANWYSGPGVYWARPGSKQLMRIAAAVHSFKILPGYNWLRWYDYDAGWISTMVMEHLQVGTKDA